MPGVNRLRELDRAATQPPWHTTSDPDLHRNETGDLEWPDHLAERLPSYWDHNISDEDAELIVALRNSVPHLLAIANAGRELMHAWNTDAAFHARARLQAALQRLEDV